MTAKEFVFQKDKELGEGWSEDTELLIAFFEEYARIKVDERVKRLMEIFETGDTQ